MCQVNLLKSHSTDVSCYKESAKIDCNKSVAPGIVAKIECNSRYSFGPNATKVFVCQENGEWNGQRTECNADCGKLVAKATPLMNIGSKTYPHEIPWYAGIYYNNKHICGGTIISGLFLIFNLIVS